MIQIILNNIIEMLGGYSKEDYDELKKDYKRVYETALKELLAKSYIIAKNLEAPENSRTYYYKDKTELKANLLVFRREFQYLGPITIEIPIEENIPYDREGDEEYVKSLIPQGSIKISIKKL